MAHLCQGTVVVMVEVVVVVVTVLVEVVVVVVDCVTISGEYIYLEMN